MAAKPATVRSAAVPSATPPATARPKKSTPWVAPMRRQPFGDTGGGIENSLRRVLDAAFREDDYRIRKGRAAENTSIARRIVLNLLSEEEDICKLGVKGKRPRSANAQGYLEAVLGLNAIALALAFPLPFSVGNASDEAVD